LAPATSACATVGIAYRRNPHVGECVRYATDGRGERRVRLFEDADGLAQPLHYGLGRLAGFRALEQVLDIAQRAGQTLARAIVEPMGLL